MAETADRSLSASRAAELSGARLLNGYDADLRAVAVDSRKLRPGDLFVALKGERTDGHRFIGDAVERGAAALLVSEAFAAETGGAGPASGGAAGGAEDTLGAGGAELRRYRLPVMAADDTLSALQRLGKKWVARFPRLRRIAITGSNGKTTTKELIASVLSRMGSTVRNEGNLNSEIGLPQALMEVREGHRYGVFELGINHPGEMDLLTEVYKPQYTVITNIGTAHIGLLGGREGIAREKGRALAALPPEGLGFIPEECQWAEYLSSISGAPLTRYGRRSTEGVERVESLGFHGWRIRYEGREFTFPLMGRHNLSNALAAVAVGRYFGASPEQIAEGIASVEDLSMRSRYRAGGITIFEDSYNANPDSMRVVIEETAGSTDPQRLVLVLGAMKELGDETESAHRELGMCAAEAGPKGIFLLGEETRASKTALEEAGYEGYLYQGDDFEELEKRLLGFVHSGDTVLLKGSRLMELERLVEPLQRAGEVYSGTGGGTAADSGKRSNAGTAADSGTQARGG